MDRPRDGLAARGLISPQLRHRRREAEQSITRLYRQIDVRRFLRLINTDKVFGTHRGEPIDVERHAPACEPKGATYTALKVAADDKGLWSAGCIVDV